MECPRRLALVLLALPLALACAGSPNQPLRTDPGDPLLCSWADGTPTASISKIVGPTGDELEILGNKIDIPAGALPQPAYVTLSQLDQDTVGVRVTVTRNGQPVSFQRDVEVTVAYDDRRCPPDGGDRDEHIIWRTEDHRTFKRLDSEKVFWRRRLRAISPSNSDYVMAE